VYNLFVVNKVVVRYQDGRIERGSTADFHPAEDVFHIITKEYGQTKTIKVKVQELKAVFFVKELLGKSKHTPKVKRTFDEVKDKKLIGKKIKVEFNDGEVLYGVTLGYSPHRKGFFLNPIDPESNNERIYAIMSAIKEVTVYE
jgi:hypothetical protein